MTRSLLLVDGEHYPAVVERGLAALRDQGHDPVAAVFLGGFEKTDAPPRLGIPMHEGRPEALLPVLIADLGVEAVLDLSDEPIIDPRTRLRLAGIATAAGAAYRGGGFEFAPVPRPRLSALAAVTVIGTGKRTGKTAAAIEIARHLDARGHDVAIVTMGRGGPPEPVVLERDEGRDPLELMARLRAQGLHATSDFVEDAVFAPATTVGTWRLGAGPTGVTVLDNFAAGVAAAVALGPDLLIYEGSGSAVPPAAADATLLVVPAWIEPEMLFGYFGAVRLALADVIVVVGPAPDIAAGVAVEAPHARILEARYEIETTVPVDGCDVVLVTTAPEMAAPGLVEAVTALGARRVEIVHSLADRRSLAADLELLGDGHLVLVEVKAAAADVVIPIVTARDIPFGLVHNRLAADTGLGDAVESVLAERAGR